MNPEIKELWISALRSGDYVQGRGQLRAANNTFCCLGVLCDLAEKADVTSAVDFDEEGFGYPRGIDGMNEFFDLPPDVREWAGIADSLAFLPESVVTHSPDGVKRTDSSLIGLNDAAEYDFNQIADVIEEQF